MMRCLFAILALGLIVTPVAAAERLKLVTSFSIIEDLVSQIVGDRADVMAIVGPQTDAHAFEPLTKHARSLRNADLFLVNGLGFEPWAERLLHSTNSRAKLIVLSKRVRAFIEVGGTTPDPHAWHDVRNAILYVDEALRALKRADPANANYFEANASKLRGSLLALHDALSMSIAAIPAQNRKVITTHDAFGYFARAYGVKFLSPLSMSSDDQPSAKSVAALIRQIKREKIAAVFVENVSDPRLIKQIATETGVALGGELYADSLSSPGGPAPNYLALMRHNAKLLTRAMSKGS